MLVSSEHSEGLISRYSSLAEKENHQLFPFVYGTLNQLRNLVHLVSTGEIEPPPHTIFSADRANEALAKIGRGLIPGRAILEFPEDDEDEDESITEEDTNSIQRSGESILKQCYQLFSFMFPRD
ncbi:uncharacterized protein LOC125030532 [Penaeus chinensis]|uniref:uncharacterized protein LOC125030532 n=1 Tax=Penaeus chinensis TaxID=139456 RepID=UPI001FB7D7E7|nr:uncharacterized protein LOC125030532 [Penaeus chinensis]